MATKSIAWNTGSGNISINYTGEGNGTIEITSDNNNLYEARSQQITVKTTDGSDIQRTITIQQAAKVRIDISTAVVTASNQTYSGSAKTPTPTVTLNGVTVPSSGYNVAYSDNTNAGTATITVTGKGDYTGIATGSFTIAKANSPITTEPVAKTGLVYNGTAQQLCTNGVASIAGTWNYPTSISAASIIQGTVYFIPNDTTNYNQYSKLITTSIAKASRTLSFTDSYVVLNTSSNVTKTATPSAGSGDGTITYSISSTTYATINSSSGEVTSKTSDGSAIVTATIAEGTNYLSATASYNLYVFATTHNYDYNGSYREVNLPPGTYQFQCWGAQGGSNGTNSSYGITAKAGGKGGYAVGQLTVSQNTAVRVYVGGQGSASAGGFNGGGSTTGTSQYNANDWFGYSKMGGGGGATDIRLSDGALLSRMIVAGGGSGGAMLYQSRTTSSTQTIDIWPKSSSAWENGNIGSSGQNTQDGNTTRCRTINYIDISDATKLEVSQNTISGGLTMNYFFVFYNSSYSFVSWTSYYRNATLTIPSGSKYIRIVAKPLPNEDSFIATPERAAAAANLIKTYTTSTTTESTYDSNGFAGGGTSGLGYSDSGGKQNAGGTSVNGGSTFNGSFGQGANQTAAAYRHCAGAGGGGWYGGASGRADEDYTTPRYSGGGSGFVNTYANRSYRPSGYTGLQLDSGETKAGNTSFPKTSGSGTETGHSGNGYARITRL